MVPTVPKKRGRPSNAEREARRVASVEQEVRMSTETIAERIDRIAERFTVLWQLTNGIARNTVRSLIVSGAPGVGKSYTIHEILEDYALKGKNKVRFVHGTITPVNLYCLLYENRAEGNVIVLDDADDIFYEDVGINLLKAALDTSLVRRISYLSESNVLKERGIETEMEYRGAMIFITNLDFQSYVNQGKNKWAKHFAALMDRSLYLDLKLHSAADLVAWVQFMVMKKGILRQMGLSESQEQDVMKFIQNHYTHMPQLSIRTAIKIGQFMMTPEVDWMKSANVLLTR